MSIIPGSYMSDGTWINRGLRCFEKLIIRIGYSIEMPDLRFEPAVDHCYKRLASGRPAFSESLVSKSARKPRRLGVEHVYHARLAVSQ